MLLAELCLKAKYKLRVMIPISLSLCILMTQTNAEVAVREMLQEIARKTKRNTGKTQLAAEDFMDDGSKIALVVDIDEGKVRYAVKCFKLKPMLSDNFF